MDRRNSNKRDSGRDRPKGRGSFRGGPKHRDYDRPSYGDRPNFSDRPQFSDRPRFSERDSTPRTMYPAKCSDCNNDCEVPFEPIEGKPVYCRNCYQNHRKPRY